jgi:uncharacterized membrane protein
VVVAVILAVAVPPANGKERCMAAHIKTYLKHLWLDADDTARLVPPAVLERLTRCIASSEQRHSGQIRICLEASLPLSYLRRIGVQCPLEQVVRERALMMFGKLGIWDTAHNNGVLIYVLLAEHAIEIVADRGLAAHISTALWTELVAHMSESFRANAYEEGLVRAVQKVSVELERFYALSAADEKAANDSRPNELPDQPVLL